MTVHCNEVAARTAAGEELGEELRGHVRVCDECSAMLALPKGLREISACRSKLEPGPGFTSRVSRSAFRTLDRRRRVRIAGMATAAACACAIVVGAFTWHLSRTSSGGQQPAVAAGGTVAMGEAPVTEVDTTAVDELASLTDVDSALAYRADWDYIQEPIAPMWLLIGEGDLP